MPFSDLALSLSLLFSLSNPSQALGYRHLYSATGGLTQTFISKPLHHQSHVLDDDAAISVGFHPMHGGVIGGQQSRANGGGGGGDITNTGGSAGSHYGVLGTCHSALAYYEAAAHGIMDELESGPTKGKVVSYLFQLVGWTVPPSPPCSLILL